SPRPGVHVVNMLFALTDTGEVKGMSAADVKGRMDLAYGSGPDELPDVWSPAKETDPMPAILWVHGGGWVGGAKSQPALYLRLLAQHGYVVVGIDYSLAPNHRFPVPVQQASRALTWMQAHADELQIDPSRIVLAGDSAGAHIAAQYAALVTDPGTPRRWGSIRRSGPSGCAVCCCTADRTTRRRPSGPPVWADGSSGSSPRPTCASGTRRASSPGSTTSPSSICVGRRRARCWTRRSRSSPR